MIKMILKQGYLIAAIISLTIAIGGCGGGGGSSPSASSGAGYVKARVSLQGTSAQAAYIAGRDAGRIASQTTSLVKVVITITGIYSESGQGFDPIVSTMQIDPNVGYGSASITQVPIGVNHLLTAVATYPSGDTETVMVIIPQVSEGVTAQVVADQASTAVAVVAIAYASQTGGTLAGIPASTITQMEEAVVSLAGQGIPYEEITLAQVQDYISGPQVETVVVETETATDSQITFGEDEQLVVTVEDSAGQAITGEEIVWTVEPSTIGTVDDSGVFTPTGIGTGTVTATVGGVSGSVTITVVAICSANADCDDSLTATEDVCVAPGSVQASCVNDAISCSSDTACDDGNALTLDSCLYGGTSYSACVHVAISCNSATDCEDYNSATADTCLNGGTESSACQHDPIATTVILCSASADCDDASVLTLDECVNAGTVQSYCMNTVIACNLSSDCTSGAAPVCIEGGTTSAACIACGVDLDCDDADSTTIDACSGGGTIGAACVHTPISVDGTVTSGGVAVADAVVRLYNDGGSFDEAVLTDSAGYYYFTGVPSGTYYIVATKDGMTLQSSTVTVP